MQRLRPKDIKDYREQQLAKQGNKCMLSGISLSPDRAVLDHSHASGKIRGVLDRGVNSFLGKIENGMKMNRIDNAMLQAICNNLQTYLNSEVPVLHPTYRTPEEKAQRAKHKRARARKKKKANA